MDEDARLGTLAIAGNLKTPGPQNTPLEGMSATGTTALLRLLGEAQATMIVMTTCHPLALPDTARPSLIIPSTTVGQEAGKGAGDTAVDKHVDCLCLYHVVAIISRYHHLHIPRDSDPASNGYILKCGTDISGYK